MASHQLTANNGGAHWVRTPLTTRISQSSLLLVTLFWGASYCIPTKLRVPFSEVFPPSLEHHSQVPMWGWGAAMVLSALMALIGERLILAAAVTNREPSYLGWRMSMWAHRLLAGIYFALLAGALVTGIAQAGWSFAGLISAVSRPVLWGYIALMHVTYSRLPSPYPDKVKPPKKGKFKLFVREPVDHGPS
jgi:hypothetical protein